jgi:hypothetical protein
MSRKGSITIEDRIYLIQNMIKDLVDWPKHPPSAKKVWLSCAKDHIESLMRLTDAEAKECADWHRKLEPKSE